ncbi:MAG: WYL domain-containing protein [Nocardiopsaceae bacterium]|jgi:predicted DNA-binding transcriptional regulator YafY|nr:WYL domain-containing protein [Nocardiopsaceae bacterium]
MAPDLSPTARALLTLEAIQNNPGITASKLGDRLGVTERAARRYVEILREADLPIESLTGPYGGYRIGRGMRLPPLMFTAAEAIGLVMAVLEGHRNAADPVDPVGGALAKIARALPIRLASPVLAFRDANAPRKAPESAVSPELVTALIESCAAAKRLHLTYRLGKPEDLSMEIDPWAVVLRHSRWYLLGWSPTREARRVLRIDRITSIEARPETFVPPHDLDALRTLEEHLSQGWTHPVEVVVECGLEDTSRWIPRSLGRLEPCDDGRTWIRATTNEPDWYARQLAAIPAPFQVIGSARIQQAMAELGRKLTASAGYAANSERR